MKIFNVFRKDLLILARDRGTYINLFLLPLMFSVVLTLALGGVFGGGEGSAPISIPVAADGDDAEVIADVVADIPGIAWDRTDEGAARSEVDDGRALAAVLVADDGESVEFYQDPAQESSAGLLYGQVASYLSAAQLTEANQVLSDALAQATGSNVDQAAEIDVTETMSGGSGVIEPTSAQQYIPGFTVAFLFFIATTIAQYVFMERERGTLRRLLTSPVSRASILVGKLLPHVLIGFGQVVVIFAVGRLMFGMGLGDPLALLLITTAAVASANGFGLMVTALSKTQAQATGTATLLVFTLATVAGCYVPLSFMPDFMQTVALATPQGWAMSAYQDIIIKGADAGGVLLSAGVLGGFALVFFLVGLSRFRFAD